MSEYSSAAPPQNNSQTAAFAAALQRARLIAAKIDSGGNKRPLEDGQEPSAKKLAAIDNSGEYQSPPGNMGGSVVGVGAGGRGPGAPGGVQQQMIPEQPINEYIRVPDKMVGLIIGRGGEQISRLQVESGCKIQMAPDSGGQPDRVCTLTGSREAVSRAKDMVNGIVNQRGRDGGPPDNGPPQQRMGGPGGGQNYEEIMVPGPKVGLIIGKGGETIKQLQEKSGAKMVVIQDGPNPEYEKPLRITGDPQKVEYAKQLVYELIAEKEMQYGGGPRGGGPGKPPGNNQVWGGGGEEFDQQGAPEGHEVLVPRIAVGVVIGKGGDMIKKIQAESGARVQFHQGHEEGPGDRRCILQGKPQQVEQARQMITDLIDSVNRRDQDGNRQSGPRGPPRNGESGGPGGGGSYGSWGGGPQDNKVEVSFTVTNIKCGIIIGRGGEVIKQINAQSGAHCELDRRTQNNRGNRTFYIRGEHESVEAAKRIITEKVGMPINFVDSNSCQNNPGGGNGGGSDYSGGYGGGQGPPGANSAVGGAAGGGVPMWGYNPHWHPSQQQQQQDPQPQQQSVPINPVTGQPDYSNQWIEYYRSMGLIQEAEKIEQQQKVSKVTAAVTGQQPTAQHPQTSVVSANGAGTGSSGVSNVPAAGSAGSQQPDYSAQWAEYYRSVGKIKEAEAIEATMKQKAATVGAVAAPANAAVGTYSAGAPYQPQPYQQQHYPGYGPYPGYPAHQPHPAPPEQQQ